VGGFDVSNAARVFDPEYYRGCYSSLLKKGADPLTHFETTGWKMGLNPNPFFSTKLYLVANRETLKAGKKPFEDFQSSSPGTRSFVSPIFDPQFYRLNNPDLRPGTEAVGHYQATGSKQGRSPNALFDVAYYRSQLNGADEAGLDYLAHYLKAGWKSDLSPHPLFDPVFYRNQLTGSAVNVAPLAHYLETGWREGLSPHPLFDPEYYLHTLGESATEPPLIHYLKRRKWDSAPHYLFSDAYYIAAVQQSSLDGTSKGYKSGPPLLHYLQFGARHGISPHPLFDLSYYRAQAARLIRDNDETGSDLSEMERDPLRHYCETGAAHDLSPTPLFDPRFYRTQFDGPVEGDPLRHYLMPEGFSVASPHPAIDLDYYSSRKADFSRHQVPVILDFLKTPQAKRTSPHPSFDPDFYLDRNPDIRDGSICPIEHFIEHGMREARQPNALFTYPYAHRLCEPGDPQFWNPVEGYFRQRGHKRPRILFLGHDASQSGAPLVLLALVKQVSALSDVECITILGSGGPLVDDYVHASFTYIVAEKDQNFLEWNKHSPQFKSEMVKIADLLDDNPPELVICNSLEARHLGDFFASRGYGPMVSLIHEVADPYDSSQISRLLAASDLAIFVSQYQLGRMKKKLAFDEDKAVIVQFGALDRWFGSGDKASAKHEVYAELGLSEGARIVLGCGTMNFRKGIDVYAEVACDVLSRARDGEDIHFVWIGGGETHYDSAYYWAEKLVRDRGFDSRVHFLGEKSQTEKYFLAADLFVLTSRADPYPCVIQEAMACSLPIVAFEGTSGAAEAFRDSGITVPFGAGPMAEAVRRLLKNKANRLERGRKARELVENANSLFSYASEIFSVVRKCAPRISEKILALPDPSAVDHEKPPVFIALPSWDCSEAHLYAAYAVMQLVNSGFKSELLFTRGPSVLQRTETFLGLPEVPFSFLYPKSQSKGHVQEEIVRRLHNVREPSIFLPFTDDFSFEMVSSLPSHISTLGLIHGDRKRDVDQILGMARHFDQIICTSRNAQQELVEENPALRQKAVLVPVRVSADDALFKAAHDARRKRGGGDEIRVVCAGFGSEELSDAVSCVRLAKLLREEQVPFRLTAIVDPAEARAIRAVAPDLIRGGTLALLISPSWTEIKSLLIKSDMLVFDSNIGLSALTVVEAMATGCVPILQLNQERESGPDELESVCFVEKGNYRKIAHHIADHQRSPALLASKSKAAHQYFRKFLSNPGKMADQYAEVCKEALVLKANRTGGSKRRRRRAGLPRQA
jgi:glycosyltransferase involved in cell wall biosynthesis